MRRSRSRTIIGTLLALGLAGSLLAISGDQVLQRMEEAMRPGEDMMATERMTVIPSDGSEEVMEIGAYQKGEKMLICIISPEEFAGIGVLVLPQEEGPGEEIYLYLPAFRAVKKIEAEARSAGFVGSDFAYEDLTMKYADKYEVQELEEGEEEYILRLLPRPKATVSYSEVRIVVNR
ncbi:MAG: outer membrane lipoprotein-sorting protein, partial [Candidatus Bipolaricaulia bacterium]